MANFTISFDNNGTPMSFELHMPYPTGEDGQVSFDVNNFSFRSGNYASYINGLNDEGINIAGYEDDGAITKFEWIHFIMDSGFEVIITGLSDANDGTYIIASFTYSPLGLDVFEYRLTLKLVSQSTEPEVEGFPYEFGNFELD